VARAVADRVGRLRMPPANQRMSEVEGALGSAAEVVRILRDEGVNAGPLIGEEGTNRHFVGDWSHALAQCGLDPAPPEVVADTRRLLGTGVLIALDLRYDERDLDETVLALERAIPR
jgi:hypothetical protein